MNNFDLKKFLVENKLTYNSKLLSEAVEVPEWLKGKLADVHGKPGQGSIFAKPIDTVMKTVQQIVDSAKNIDQVANSTGTLTVSSPGIGYNLVLPLEQAMKLPGAKQGEVEKVEGPNKVKVPSVTTTAPLSQFASDKLTVIVRPKKDEAGTVIPNEYIVLSAFPGDPDIPRASEWGGKFAVVIPGGEQGVNEQVDLEKGLEQLLSSAAQSIKSQSKKEQPSKQDGELNEIGALTVGALLAGAPGLLNLLGKVADGIGGFFSSGFKQGGGFKQMSDTQKGTVVGNALKKAGHNLEHKYVESIGGWLQAAFPKRYTNQDVHDKTTKLFDDAHKIYAGLLVGGAIVSGADAVHAVGTVIGGLEGGATALKAKEVIDIAQKITAA